MVDKPPIKLLGVGTLRVGGLTSHETMCVFKKTRWDRFHHVWGPIFLFLGWKNGREFVSWICGKKH